MPKHKAKPNEHQDSATAAEQRVHQLMDPSVPDTLPAKATKTKAESPSSFPEPATAPEVPELPVPKEPLKIKIIGHDEPAGEAHEAPPAEAEADTELAEADDDTRATEEAQPDAPQPEDADPQIDQAVDDIIRHESDALLTAEDEKLAQAFGPEPKKRRGPLRFFAAWWHSPKARWATILVLLVGMIAAGLVPTSRYYALNTAGVRASLSVQVMDESTFQPLKNVTVSANGASAQTDAAGVANLEKVRLGPTQLKIEKRAFAAVTKDMTIGWGSNPIGEVQLKPVGTQYIFVLNDYLSGKGVAKAEATSDDASALSDESGHLKLTMDEPPDQIQVTIRHTGYREEKLTISADDKNDHTIQMVPDRKHVFVSKRAGKYDVYKVDLDGKNEELVLAGTGLERPDMVLLPHPSREIVALVSTRDAKRDGDGYLLSTLTVIDLASKDPKAVASSERVQIVDWTGDRLVYVQVAAGESAVSPKRHRLMSYDYRNGDNRELAASNYFNDVMVAGGKLYYAPSSTYQPAGVGTNVFRSDGDGGNKQIILNKEAWNLFRSDYDHITLSAPGEWYDYKLGTATPAKLDGEPANLVSRIYVDSPDGSKSVWADSRDGKGVLLAYNITDQKDTPLHTQSGLKNPVRWLSNQALVYRIKTDQETADYAISPDGGDPKKIRDVTDVNGLDQWYYY